MDAAAWGLIGVVTGTAAVAYASPRGVRYRTGPWGGIGEPAATLGYARISGVAQPVEAIPVANATTADT